MFEENLMPRELEIKLTLTPENLRGALAWLTRQSASKVKGSQRLLNRYFDTPSGDLNRNRVALRVRSVGNRYIQTLKTKGAFVNGAHNRQEWEWLVPGPNLDLSLLQHTPVAEMVDPGELAPVFDTDFERHVVMLEDRQASIECALDQGVIRGGERERPLCELELELKSGDDACLLKWARHLSGEVPVFLNLISKAEQGYYLAGLHDPEWSTEGSSLERLLQGLSLTWLTGKCPEGFQGLFAQFEREATRRGVLGEWQWLQEQVEKNALTSDQLTHDPRPGRFQLTLLGD
jgi:inorganic triphosphatase YgiF